MVDQCICLQSPRNRISLCFKIWHFRRRISRETSTRVDGTGFDHLRGGYGSIYGRGHSRISVFEAATNFLYVFNMSATMARQRGRVQWEQSDMRLALNMANMAKGRFSRAGVEETQYLIKKPRAQVREEKKRGVESPEHNKVKAERARHPAMLRQNPLPGCIPCQNGTAKNPQTRWRRKGTGASLPTRHRQQNPEPTPKPTPEPTPPLPGTPLASTGNTSADQRLEIINLPAGYTYSHTSLPSAESFTLDASAQESEHDTDFDPDMLPDEGTSTG